MITVPTVLVLGAGASSDFQFPTGNDLKTEIIQNLSLAPVINQVANLAKLDPKKVIAFRDSLNHSGKGSVDAFLEHRPEFIEVGKIVIAQALIPYEKEENLFPRGKVTWYEHLYNKMNAKFEEFEENQLSIITFNYDRSIERFLFLALQNSYERSNDEVTEKIKTLRIIHVHGKLGDLPWQKDPRLQSVRGYHNAITPQEIQSAAQSIKIIHDKIDLNSDLDFQNAREILSHASRVIFLGFGYDAINLQRLGMDFRKTDKEIFGTCYGFEKEEVKGKARSFCYDNIEFGEPEDKIIDFLRKKNILERPAEIDFRKMLLRKIRIISIVEAKLDSKMNASVYAEIIESFSQAEAAMLDGYISSIGGGGFSYPITDMGAAELCQKNLSKKGILTGAASGFKLSPLGYNLGNYVRRYGDLIRTPAK